MPKLIVPSLVGGLSGGIAGLFAGGLPGAFAGFGIAFTSTLVLGAINQALYKDPKVEFPPLLASGGQNISVREAAPSRQVIYGETRAGGAMFYVEAIGSNKLLNVLMAYAGHEIDSYGLHYFGQDTINVQNLELSDTRLLGTEYTNLHVDFHTFGGGTSGRIGRGTVGDVETSSLNYVNSFGHQQLTFQVTGSNNGNDGIYQRVISRNDDISQRFMNVTRIDNLGNISFENNVAITLRVQHIWVAEKYGTATQTAVGLAEMSSNWKPGYKALGVAYAWYRLGWNAALYPQGLENISAVVKGKKVYDPRTSLTVWSNNPALCLVDYLIDTDYGMGFDYATEIDETKLIAAANVCDETVSLAAGGTEKRYTCNGRFLTTQRPKEIVNALLSSMAGRRTWSGGKWHIYAGAYVSPAININEDDLRGQVRVQTRYSKRNLFNAVKGTFIDPEQKYEPMDFRFQESATFKAQDGGETLWRDTVYPFTQSGTMAQRLARIDLLYVRQQIEVFLECKFTTLELVPGDTVQLSLSRYGWTGKIFEVLELTHQVSTKNPGIDISLKETASTIYDWDTSLEQTIDPAPDTNLPSPWIVSRPSGVLLSDDLRRQADGSVLTVLQVSWDQGGDLTGIEWIVEYRIAIRRLTDVGDQWSTIRSEFTLANIAPVIDGERYEVRVAAINSLGSRSEYSDLVWHEVVGKTDPPADVDALEVYELPNGVRRAVIRYTTLVTDLATFELRYKSGQSGDWDDLGNPLRISAAGLIDNNVIREFFRPVEAGDYRFGVKAVDTTGNYSDNAVFVDVTFTAVPNVLYEFDFKALGWPGTKTGCHVDARTGDLMPNTLNTWGTSGLTWEGAGQWRGNPVSTYIYEHVEIDLGSDQTLTPSVVYNTTAASVSIQEKHKTDAGSYTSFAAISGDITFRYIIIKITVTV